MPAKGWDVFITTMQRASTIFDMETPILPGFLVKPGYQYSKNIESRGAVDSLPSASGGDK